MLDIPIALVPTYNFHTAYSCTKKMPLKKSQFSNFLIASIFEYLLIILNTTSVLKQPTFCLTVIIKLSSNQLWKIKSAMRTFIVHVESAFHFKKRKLKKKLSRYKNISRKVWKSIFALVVFSYTFRSIHFILTNCTVY